MIYGEGVIYLADKEVIRDILPEDGLFLPLPEGVPATVFDSAGCGIGVRLNMLSVLADYPLPDSFCYFVRAPKTEDKALLHYFEKNQSPAMETLLRLFH